MNESSARERDRLSKQVNTRKQAFGYGRTDLITHIRQIKGYGMAEPIQNNQNNRIEIKKGKCQL
jgi:hypothetical protein